MRNIVTLAVCQMLFNISGSIQVSIAALVGYGMIDAKGYATMPIAAMIIGNAIASMPAPLLMRRIGRRAGFRVGTAIAVVGSAVAGYAIWLHSFPVYCGGTFLIGMYHGFGQHYRFAATDGVGESERGRSISYVLLGGVAAAFLGPELAKLSKDWIPDVAFMGAYLVLIVCALLAMILLGFLNLPKREEVRSGAGGRPLREIVRRPEFMVAALCGMMSYGVMNLLMAATPLAMHAHQHSFSSTAFVIQWHVVAMFAPSLITGHLLRRFGVVRIIGLGNALLVFCVVAAISGSDVFNFWLALALLGLGWNFMFVGASTLVTDVHREEEREKVQGANDVLVFGTVAVTATASGQLHHWFGWEAIALGSLPWLAVSAAALWWLAVARRKARIGAALG
jgi:MFS family permease